MTDISNGLLLKENSEQEKRAALSFVLRQHDGELLADMLGLSDDGIPPRPMYRVLHGDRRDLAAERERKRRQRKRTPPPDVTHGRASTYQNWGCRCDPCRQANTDDWRKRRGAA